MKKLLCKYYLDCRYDSRASFYNKAQVEHFDDGTQILTSYSTVVAVIKNDTAFINGFYSQTTTRHIREFLKQNGFKADSKNQMAKDYMIEDSQFRGLTYGY